MRSVSGASLRPWHARADGRGARPAAALTTALAMALAAGAAQGQADEADGREPAFRLRAGGGEAIDSGLLAGRGTAALPLADRLSVELELAGGMADEDGFFGGGGHLFWRDPEVGLVGVFGSYTEWDSISSNRVGARAHLFVDQFTLRGRVSQQFGDVAEGVVGDLDVRWYVTEDLAALAGASYVTSGSGDWLTRLSAEYRPGWQGLEDMTVFVDGTAGEDDFHTVLVGVSYSFREIGSLMRRDRELVGFDSFGEELFPINRRREDLRRAAAGATAVGGGDGGEEGGGGDATPGVDETPPREGEP